MKELNRGELARIAQTNKTAESLFTYAACRERNARDGATSISAIRKQMLKEGFHPVPSELVDSFRELQKVGIGTYKNGMFKWNYSMKEVGKAALESVNIDPEQKDDSRLIEKPIIAKVDKRTRHMVISLSDSRWINMDMPVNVTDVELKYALDIALNRIKE